LQSAGPGKKKKKHQKKGKGKKRRQAEKFQAAEDKERGYDGSRCQAKKKRLTVLAKTPNATTEDVGGLERWGGEKTPPSQVENSGQKGSL